MPYGYVAILKLFGVADSRRSMDWSSYYYLAGCAILASLLFIAMIRLIPRLVGPSSSFSLLEGTTLGSILVLGILIIYFNFYVGESYYAYWDSGTDTIEQYVPFYLNMVESIRQGTFGAWCADYGLGTSSMAYQSWALDPFNVVLVPICLLFGDQALNFALVFTQSLKILLCGFLFNRVLARYCETPLARIVGATVYAFCGFLILWGQHYWLGSVIVVATALLVLLEAIISKWTVPRFIGLCLITAVSCIMSTYSGFMVMVFGTTYAVLRIAYLSDSPRAFFALFGRAAFPVVCGLLISAVTLVPYATSLLTESGRISSGDSSLLASASSYITRFVPLSWISFILSRMLGNSLITTSPQPAASFSLEEGVELNFTYEFIQLGFSIAVLILLGQFFAWLWRKGNRKTKIIACVATLICLLYCFNLFLPALTNVFADVKYRSCFAIAAPVCIALAIAFEKCVMNGKVYRVNFVVMSFASLAIVGWSAVNSVNARLLCFAMLLALVVLVVGTAFLVRRPGSTIALVCVCACMFGSMFVDGFYTVNGRATASVDNFPSAIADTESSDAATIAALEWIAEQDDGFYRVEKTYADWTAVSDGMVQSYSGVSNYNSTIDSDLAEFYRKVWPEVFGTAVPAVQVFLNDPYQPELLRLLGISYLLSYDDLTFDWCEKLTEIDGVSVYKVLGADTVITAYSSFVTENEADSMTADERKNVVAGSAIIEESVADTLLLTATQTDCSMQENGAGALSGTISTDGSAVVCLSIPYTTGWHVSVDGQEVETFRLDYGFIGFTVDEGEHQITAQYIPNGWATGATVGCVGVLVTIVSCVILAWRRRKMQVR